jgi:hypothetical protein
VKEYEYILTYQSVSETLTVNPAGWDKVGINFVRHEVYHSVLRSFTVSIRFAKVTSGGTDFILNAYNTEGINANVLITINRRNKANNKFELFHSGSLDMKTMLISRDFIEISVMDGMKLQRLISRDEIDYNLFNTTSTDNISIPDFTSQKSISLPPIDIVLDAEFNGTHNLFVADALALIYEGEIQDVPYINITTTKNTIGERIEFVEDQAIIYTNSTLYDIELKIQSTSVFNLTAWFRVIDGFLLQGMYFKIQHGFFVYDEDSNLLDSLIMYNEEKLMQTDESDDDVFYTISDLNLSGIKTMSVPANGYMEFCTKITLISSQGAGSGVQRTLYIYTPSGKSTPIHTTIVEYSVGATESTTLCMFPHEAFTRLIQLTTSETDTTKLLYSELLGRTDSEFTTYPDDGIPSKDALFTGYMVRKFPNASLTANLRALFQSFDAVYNIGLGFDKVNDRFTIEPKRTYFDSSYFMFDLGEVSDLKIIPAMSKYFSKLTGGYENEGDYQDYQGAYEFNIKREYALSTPVKDEKIIQAKYNFDSIGVELSRRKPYTTFSSLDTKQDNNLFIVRTDGAAPVLNPSVTGFPGVEKYYNTMLSPRQNALRSGNIIRPALYKNSNPVKFQTASKYISINTGVDDFTDIQQSELDTALFRPELYSFKSYINSVLLGILNTNPHGFIRFTYEGTTYEGFINSIETGDYNKEASYELIAKEIETGKNLTYESDVEMLYENDLNILTE